MPIQRLRHQLRDSATGQTTEIIVEASRNWLEIGVVGYGSPDAEPGYGRPIAVEIYKGELRVVLWHPGDETQVISIERSRDADCVQLIDNDLGESAPPNHSQQPAYRRLHLAEGNTPTPDAD